MHKNDMDTLPLDVSDDERLARAVFYPLHLDKKGKLKKEALKAPTGRRDVSVNRLRALDADACKARSKAIRNPGEFKGFAAFVAGSIRDFGSEVVDSREEYLGHADIVHPIALEKGVPAPPEFNQRLREMALRARYFPDSDPESDCWSGEDFSSELVVIAR